MKNSHTGSVSSEAFSYQFKIVASDLISLTGVPLTSLASHNVHFDMIDRNREPPELIRRLHRNGRRRRGACAFRCLLQGTNCGLRERDIQCPQVLIDAIKTVTFHIHNGMFASIASPSAQTTKNDANSGALTRAVQELDKKMREQAQQAAAGAAAGLVSN